MKIFISSRILKCIKEADKNNVIYCMYLIAKTIEGSIQIFSNAKNIKSNNKKIQKKRECIPPRLGKKKKLNEKNENNKFSDNIIQYTCFTYIYTLYIWEKG